MSGMRYCKSGRLNSTGELASTSKASTDLMMLPAASYRMYERSEGDTSPGTAANVSICNQCLSRVNVPVRQA